MVDVVAVTAIRRTIDLDLPIDLARTYGPLWRRDPTMSIRPGVVARATRTPDGPGTLSLRSLAPTRVEAMAWGDGAEWLIARSPAMAGADDDLDGFEPVHPLVRNLHRQTPGLRVIRTEAVLEALVPTIIEQKVVAADARRSYRRLLWKVAEPAPGPLGLTLPATPERLAELQAWDWHRFGVEQKRALTVGRAARSATHLEATVAMTPADAAERLCSVPGIGPWTAAEVALFALGDADAVSVGDYHLPNVVSFALAGEPRGSDGRMLELLEPYRGHRGPRTSTARSWATTTEVRPAHAPPGPRRHLISLRTTRRGFLQQDGAASSSQVPQEVGCSFNA